MNAAARFPYVLKQGGSGPLDMLPIVPVSLSHSTISLDVMALIDSGASMSVLPYNVGLAFGMSWKLLPHSLYIGGAGGSVQAKRLDLTAVVAPFAPTSLTFAWVNTNSYPFVLGHANFLFKFDVFLSRRHSYFEIQPATP